MSGRYRHVETGEIVSIMNDNGNFYTLNNGAKIVKNLFVQKYVMQNVDVNENIDGVNADQFLNQQTVVKFEVPKTANQNYTSQNENVIVGAGPVVDPIDFLHSHVTPIQGLETIQNINTNKIVDDNVTGPIVRVIDPNEQVMGKSVTTEQEKHKLLEDWNRKAQNNGIQGKFENIDENDDKAIQQFLNQNQPLKPKKQLNENGLTQEQEYMRQEQIKLSGVDPFAEKITKYRQQQEYGVNLDSSGPIPTNTEYSQSTKVEDPTSKIFKTFKRAHPITIKMNIKDKISKPEFIQIMAEGLEGDIIKYYAEEILRSYLSDIPKLKEEIYNQIYKEVYGELPKVEEEIVETKVEIKPKIVKSKVANIKTTKTKTTKLKMTKKEA